MTNIWTRCRFARARKKRERLAQEEGSSEGNRGDLWRNRLCLNSDKNRRSANGTIGSSWDSTIRKALRFAAVRQYPVTIVSYDCGRCARILRNFAQAESRREKGNGMFEPVYVTINSAYCTDLWVIHMNAKRKNERRLTAKYINIQFYCSERRRAQFLANIALPAGSAVCQSAQLKSGNREEYHVKFYRNIVISRRYSCVDLAT